MCAIKATCRWAVTGTPIQNRLTDLAALLKFLHIDPYSDIQRFDADITHLWKSGQAEEAVKRLKRLSNCILLRRPKATINLPNRKDLSCPIEFNVEERTLYDELKYQTVSRMKDYYLDDTQATFVNVIQQINSLRMICSMGLHYNVRHHDTSERNSVEEYRSWGEYAQQAFNFQCEAGPVNCHICSSSTETVETMSGDSQRQPQHRFSQCLRFICHDCMQSSRRITCGHSQPHQLALVSTSQAIMEDPPAAVATLTGSSSTLAPSELPSKVTSLVTQLKSKRDDVKS